jgi:SGNH domain (fused to AT3 domains)/Acyltransferase family
LSVEEQFYLVYPFVLILGRRYLRDRWLWLLLPLCFLSLAASFIVSSRDQEAAFYLAPFRAWEFLLGTLIAVTAIRQPSHRLSRELLAAVGIGLIVWSVVTYSESLPILPLSLLATCIGAGLLVWLSGSRDTLVGRALASAPLVFVGLMSYSIYLWHWPILVFARYIAVQDLTWTQRVALVLAATALAYPSWRFIELPIRQGVYWRGWRIIASSSVVAAVALLFAYAGVTTGGMPGRIEPEILALKARPFDIVRCHNVTVERVNTGDICIRGTTTEKPSFVLVGDSHAAMLAAPVFAAAARAGLSGYQITADSFRPLPGVQLLKKQTPLTNRFVEFLRDHTEVHKVILAGFWQFQALGISYRNRPTVFSDSGYDGSGLAYNKVSFQNSLQRLVDAFPDRRFVLGRYPCRGRAEHF